MSHHIKLTIKNLRTTTIMKVLGVLIAIQVALPIATSLIFKKNINFRKSSPTFSTVASGDASATWQEQLDQILDVDTPCEGRRELSINILK